MNAPNLVSNFTTHANRLLCIEARFTIDNQFIVANHNIVLQS